MPIMQRRTPFSTLEYVFFEKYIRRRMAIIMRAPTFQLMPKMRFIPAPLPEILPKVKKRQEKKRQIPTKAAAPFP